MASLLSTSSAALHNSGTNNLKTLFVRDLDFQIVNHNLVNNYIIYCSINMQQKILRIRVFKTLFK